MRKLSVFEPVLMGNEATWVSRALSENQISGTSPIVGDFEKAFASFSGNPHSVAIANGTAAIHVALLALGIGPGDEVLVPNMTIISDAIGVILCRAKPVFVEVGNNDYCLDTKQLEAWTTKRTKAVLAVHMYGNACDMDFLRDYCRAKKLFLIEDAAQAMGATWRGKPLGALGDVSTYSFYPNKLITTGEGGAVACHDKAVADKAKVIRNLGFDPNPDRRFIHAYFSNNYRLSGLQAAMGLAQLENVTALKQKRDRVSESYRKLLSGVSQIELSESDVRSKPAFWMQTIVLKDDVKLSVTELALKLQEAGIETRRFFYPLHAQPVLAPYHDQKEISFPISQRLFDRGLYLPSSPLLSDDDIEYVATSLKRILAD